MQALDAGLDPADSSPSQQFQLLSLQVGFGFVKQFEGLVSIRQYRHNRFEVGVVQNVVDHEEPVDLVAAGKLLDFFQHSLFGLAAITHPASVQATKGAVMFLSPPAATGRFHDQTGQNVEVTGLQCFKIIIKVGCAGLVHGREVGANSGPALGVA